MQPNAANPPLTLLSPQWSSDGKYLLHLEQNGPSGARLVALSLSGDRKSFDVVQARSPQGRIFQFRLSPDGHWLAYSSTDSGSEEVYVSHFPSGEGRWQVSQAGGTYPSWRGDSNEIYFFGLDGYLHSASVNSKGPEFSLNEIHTLFPIAFSAPLGNPYDVSPDGQRFIFSMLPEGISSPMVLVTNWLADLKK